MKTVTTFLTNMLRTTHRLDRPHPHLEGHMGAPSLSRRKHLKFGRGGETTYFINFCNNPVIYN